jgi:hypothetical protein
MYGDFRLWITKIIEQHFRCIHDYKVDRMSLLLPMPILWQCSKCGKWRN